MSAQRRICASSSPDAATIAGQSCAAMSAFSAAKPSVCSPINVVVEHRLARRLALEHDLHHALDQRKIAADLDMDELAGHLGRSEGRHLDDVLRFGEADQRAFGHRVDRDDRDAAFARLDQRGHHPRRVGPGVVADQEDRLGMFEIVEDYRPLADTDRRRQPAARRFVAHVRTVGKIVRPELAHEDRIEERRLVRGAARGVEFGLMRAVEGAQDAGRSAQRHRPSSPAHNDRSRRHSASARSAAPASRANSPTVPSAPTRCVRQKSRA